MTWTDEHKAIFEAVASGRSVGIRAAAGTGKSTTLKECYRLLPKRNTETFLAYSIRFLTFGKDAAESLKAAGVPASTFHSYGFGIYRPNVPGFKKPDFDKTKDLLGKFTKWNDDFVETLRLISFGKQCLTPPTEEDLQECIRVYGLDFSNEERALSNALKTIQAGMENLSTCDFDEMLCLPVWLGWDFPQQDYLLVDEAQDTNALQLEMLRRSRGAKTRAIIVGDPFQGIYGFRGAGETAMEEMEREFGCELFPLSMTYRCTHAVSRYADKFLKEWRIK